MTITHNSDFVERIYSASGSSAKVVWSTEETPSKADVCTEHLKVRV